MRLHRAMQENIDMAKAKKFEFEQKMELLRQDTVNQTLVLNQKRREAADLFMKLPFSSSLSQLLDTLTSTLGDLGDKSAQEREFVTSVQANPEDADVVYREVMTLLRSFNHPLGQYMQQYSVRFKQQYADVITTKSNTDADFSTVVQTMTSETHAFTSMPLFDPVCCQGSNFFFFCAFCLRSEPA